MEQFDVSIIVEYTGNSDEVLATVESIVAQKCNYSKRTNVVIFSDKAFIDELKNTMSNYSDRIGKITLLESSSNKWKSFEKCIQAANGQYIILLNSGDILHKVAVAECINTFEQFGERLDTVIMKCSFINSKAFKKKYSRSTSDERILLNINELEDLLKMPTLFDGACFRRSSIASMHFNIDQEYGIWNDFVYRLIDKKRTLVYNPYAMVRINKSSSLSNAKNEINTDINWYTKTLLRHGKGTVNYFKNKYGELPLFIQFRLLNYIKLRFHVNHNRNQKHVVIDDELNTFYGVCHELLQEIDDMFLVASKEYSDSLNMAIPLQNELFKLKYSEGLELKYTIDEVEGVKGTKNALKVVVNGRILPGACLPPVHLDLADYDEKGVYLDCATVLKFEDYGLSFKALLNDEECQLIPKTRYKKDYYFDGEPLDWFTFQIRIPYEKLGKKATLRFELKAPNGNVAVLRVRAIRFTAKISMKIRTSYWYFNNYIMEYDSGENRKSSIVFRKSNKLLHLARELRLLGSMIVKYRARKVCIDRILYWLTYPVYHRRNIWISNDKLYKGGDNGEYFYKYAMTRKKDTNVYPYYVVNADAPDLQRLRQEGYEPLVYGSKKHRLMFLHCKMYFATHAGIHSFNNISPKETPFLQDLFNFDATCIQHGLTVQNLMFNANRTFNNNRRYYCASKYEVENLLQDGYGYSDTNPEAIKLTGVPRYDGLINNDLKQILITPTWRNYIVLEQPDKNSLRNYSPSFKNTDYFRIYNQLISDKRLVETANRTGYKLIYLIHPAICQQAEDFEVHEGVEIRSALDINYEQILTESSLMVTDYSGVQFDFAYMRKPIVYYHHPLLPPHYEEGGFFYEKQGFGEICTDHEEIVKCLCDYMENQCRTKDFYIARQDDFFEYRDRNNCQRIFEDAIKYQKEKGNF